MFEFLKRRARRRRMITLKYFGDISENTLRLSLGDLNTEVADRLAYYFQGLDHVEVAQGSLLNFECDAIVSPANSFGDMSGGIDKAIDDFYQGEAQRRITQVIRKEFYGELPVGLAIIVEMPSTRFPFVIAAPTMRIPGNVNGSINAYLAMRAVLVAVQKHNSFSEKRIRSIAISGLCTGVGGMTADDAAMQMRVAYNNILGEQWRNIVHPVQAPFVMGTRQIKPS